MPISFAARTSHNRTLPSSPPLASMRRQVKNAKRPGKTERSFMPHDRHIRRPRRNGNAAISTARVFVPAAISRSARFAVRVFDGHEYAIGEIVA